MSRTYRIKKSQVPSWTMSYWAQWYPEYSKRRSDAEFHRDGRDWYMSTPSWWIHDTMTIKERARTRMAIQKVYKLIDYEDYVEFPLDKKPHEYYW